MSTRSFIALEEGDKYKAIYCHWDGYPEHNGKILVANYNTQEKIKKLGSKSTLKPGIANSEARLYIADKSEIIFMITSDNADEEIAVWLNSPFFAQSICALMDNNMRKIK
jgi:hypothetical protein